MSTYAYLNQDFQKLSALLQQESDHFDEQEYTRYVLAGTMKIWGANCLYSPEYSDIILETIGLRYTPEQIMTAMSCCSDADRKMAVPRFFSDLLHRKDASDLCSKVIDLLNQLFIGLALANGDFTIEEAQALSEVLQVLIDHCTSQKVELHAETDTSQLVTERKEESYLQKISSLEQKKEALKPELPKETASEPINITVTLEVNGPGTDQGDTISMKDDIAPPAQNETDSQDTGTLEELLAELDGLVGLETVKQDVHSLMNFIKVAQLRKARGMKVPTISYHLVFTGNPGTGKTTVARLVAQLYYRMGILPQGQLVETDRSALVAGYLGQTAIKTQKVIQQALGGVLFIDEAYSLARETEDSYGKEAIETILKAMEDHRDELVVIVAGYDELMHQFIDSNPGLASRFSKYFKFPDYTGEEMLKIFERFCRINGYRVDESVSAYLLERFNQMYDQREEHFGNARAIRNLFEKALNCQANRIANQNVISDADLELLTSADIDAALKEG